MAKTDAQKRARDKWNRANTAPIAVSVRTEVKEQFRAACERNGTTMNAVLFAAIMEYLEKHGKQ